MIKLIKKQSIKFFLGTALAGVIPGALNAATISATVDAQISTNATLSASTGMVFGDMTAGNLGGTVVLDPDGRRVSTGTVSLNRASVSSPATLSLAGTPNGTYSIVLPSNVVLSDGGANNMLVTDFTSFPDVGGQLNGSGVATVKVGGKLNVGANQGFGNYSGSMTVVINYF
jgi:hypothetical protein